MKAEPDLAAILRLPGVIAAPIASIEDNLDRFSELVSACLKEALGRLDQMRQSEGRVLSAELSRRLQSITEHVTLIEGLAQRIRPAYMKRLEARLKELLHESPLDPARLAQEAAIAAERSDVSEELSRLRSHVLHFEAMLTGGAEAGKKLDFLLQEMQRESNTLLSKTPGTETEGMAMTELGLADQIRNRKVARASAKRRVMMDVAKEPLVLIVSGPSGSGKSTLVEKILELPGMSWSVSCTTRPPRANEQPGKCYNYVSEETFRGMIERGEFLEYAQVFGRHSYGTPRKWLDEAREHGKDLVLEIDVQGAAQVKKKVPGALAIFILPPSRQDLEKRLRARGQDAEDEITRRLNRARDELRRYNEYDYVVINDDLERAGREVQAIATGARCSVERNEERVRNILKSFGG